MCLLQARQSPPWGLARNWHRICCLCLGPRGWVLRNPRGMMLISCIPGKWQVDWLPTDFWQTQALQIPESGRRGRSMAKVEGHWGRNKPFPNDDKNAIRWPSPGRWCQMYLYVQLTLVPNDLWLYMKNYVVSLSHRDFTSLLLKLSDEAQWYKLSSCRQEDEGESPSQSTPTNHRQGSGWGSKRCNTCTDFGLQDWTL